VVRIRPHPSLKVQGSVELEAALAKLGCQVTWDGFNGKAQAAAAGAV
jgi:hypothetical protein